MEKVLGLTVYLFDKEASLENIKGPRLIVVSGRIAYHLSPELDEKVKNDEIQAEFLPDIDYREWCRGRDIILIERPPNSNEIKNLVLSGYATANVIFDIKDRLKRIEEAPKVEYSQIFFEGGLKALRERLEEEIKRPYQKLEPLLGLLKLGEEKGFSNLDENWAKAVLSIILLESIVRRKVEELGEKPSGNLAEAANELQRLLKEKEGKDFPLSQVRGWLTGGRAIPIHAIHQHPINEKDASDIYKFTKSLLELLW